MEVGTLVHKGNGAEHVLTLGLSQTVDKAGPHQIRKLWVKLFCALVLWCCPFLLAQWLTKWKFSDLAAISEHESFLPHSWSQLPVGWTCREFLPGGSLILPLPPWDCILNLGACSNNRLVGNWMVSTSCLQAWCFLLMSTRGCQCAGVAGDWTLTGTFPSCKHSSRKTRTKTSPQSAYNQTHGRINPANHHMHSTHLLTWIDVYIYKPAHVHENIYPWNIVTWP